MRDFRSRSLSALVILLLPVLSSTTEAQKKPLTQADWDRWRSIAGAALSRDGKWAVYTLVPLSGDGELVVRATSGTTEYRVPRGYLGRANNVPGGLRGPAGGTGEGDPTGPQASPAQITADSRFVIVTTQPPQAEAERILVANRGPRAARGTAAANRLTLAIMDLRDGKVTTIPGVRSFRLPRESGAWLAYVPEPDSAAAGADSASRGGARPGGAAPRRTYGSPLVLRNLGTGAEERLTDVLGYAFDDGAKLLAYTDVSRDSTKDGAFVRTLESGAVATLASGRGNY
ncbi:MAG: hypothetical protein HOP28_17535, partial [Gemmatimonadales bacterium]|nr:hypothetical protein [Gemmatimonadales bacterium]